MEALKKKIADNSDIAAAVIQAVIIIIVLYVKINKELNSLKPKKRKNKKYI